MAEPLKNSFGTDVPRRIAGMIQDVEPAFPVAPFLEQALAGYDELELMDRARHIAVALHAHLPDDYAKAIDTLLRSLGPIESAVATEEDSPMASFLYMPHCLFVADYGLDHFDLSMQANYELTKRFTAEFSIRPYLVRYPRKTLTLLKRWTKDPSPDVRRLVSEGTRPRLPWASRLPQFQADPTPVLDLLERLKDDPSLYVRRSVANNLNDIGKDHPDVLVQTADAWMKNADENRAWVVRHALRSAVKRGDAGALRVLGFGDARGLRVEDAAITPDRLAIGDSVVVCFAVRNTARGSRSVMVDFRIHYVKANGSARPKVFKLKAVDIPAGETVPLRKKVSLANMSTRTHYPGSHQVDAVINGRIQPIGSFLLS